MESSNLDRSKISKGKQWVLTNCVGCTNSLSKIMTSIKTKSVTINEIRLSLQGWMENKEFDMFRNQKIDLAIVVYTNKNNLERQDVDNIAKVVLDALCMNRNHEGSFLFNNDNQIVRLLVYKMEKTPDDYSDTDEFIISFRAHDPKLPMELGLTSL